MVVLVSKIAIFYLYFWLEACFCESRLVKDIPIVFEL